MVIQVISSVGTGNTLLSAFDASLKNAGILNFNLIPLSSVIPSRAQVLKQRYFEHTSKNIGNRLYLVKAEIRVEDLDSIIGAGLGWYFFQDGGVFVEHEVVGFTIDGVKTELERQINSSLMDLCQNRNIPFDISQAHHALSICPAMPTPRSALVVAVYEEEEWKTIPYLENKF